MGNAFEYNRDKDAREMILFGEGYSEENYAAGQIRYFKRVPAAVIEQLMAEKFADPDDKHNEAPSIQEFVSYAKEHPGVLFSGYAIDAKRDDYRISIDRVEQDGFRSPQEASEFHDAFYRHADEISVSNEGGSAWWD